MRHLAILLLLLCTLLAAVDIRGYRILDSPLNCDKPLIHPDFQDQVTFKENLHHKVIYLECTANAAGPRAILINAERYEFLSCTKDRWETSSGVVDVSTPLTCVNYCEVTKGQGVNITYTFYPSGQIYQTVATCDAHSEYPKMFIDGRLKLERTTRIYHPCTLKDGWYDAYPTKYSNKTVHIECRKEINKACHKSLLSTSDTGYKYNEEVILFIYTNIVEGTLTCDDSINGERRAVMVNSNPYPHLLCSETYGWFMTRGNSEREELAEPDSPIDFSCEPYCYVDLGKGIKRSDSDTYQCEDSVTSSSFYEMRFNGKRVIGDSLHCDFEKGWSSSGIQFGRLHNPLIECRENPLCTIQPSTDLGSIILDRANRKLSCQFESKQLYRIEALKAVAVSSREDRKYTHLNCEEDGWHFPNEDTIMDQPLSISCEKYCETTGEGVTAIHHGTGASVFVECESLASLHLDGMLVQKAICSMEGWEITYAHSTLVHHLKDVFTPPKFACKDDFEPSSSSSIGLLLSIVACLLLAI